MRITRSASSLRRGLLGALVAVALLALVPLFSAGSAQASSAAYPPPSCTTLSLSSTRVAEGGTLTVSGTAYVPGQKITIELTSGTHVTDLKTVSIGASGKFTTTVTLPAGVSGHDILSVKGSTVAACRVDPITIVVQGTPANNGGAPAMTGFDVLALLIGGALLVLVGVALVIPGRRSSRRRHHRSRHVRLT